MLIFLRVGAEVALKSFLVQVTRPTFGGRERGGLALAGRAGARLARVMGITTSRTTLLRRVMDLLLSVSTPAGSIPAGTLL
ncbi:hypothetical protein AB0D71_45365 [Streptomyces avermitilis]|uniref:hypothetical protein n=1 Tax=Streptomyces avermitilis TaxID=33903 RepID=UPI00340C795C